jgi:hypothetical protein
MKSTNNQIKLDWAKLLGFCQVKSAQQGSADAKKLMAMIGSKIGSKAGTKTTSPS